MAFKQMPNNWDLLKLADVAEVKYGKAKPKEIGKIPVIGSGGIYGHTENALIDFPTIIIGRKGTAGLAWLQEQPCWPSDTTFYLNWKNEKIDYNYLYYYLKGHPLSGQHARTTLPSLLKQDLENYSLFVPPIPEQRAIARALHAVQGAREARLREMALEKERKAALMEHLFTHGTRGEATKMTEIGEMPVSWTVVRLGEVLDVQLGKMLSNKARAGISPRPYLRNANVRWGKIDLSDLYEMDFSDAEAEKFELKYGDVLVCEGGEIGRTAIWRNEMEGCCYQKAIHRLRPKNNLIIPEYFLYYFMMAFIIRNTYGVSGTKTTIAHLPAIKLKMLKIPIPDMEEQKEISSVLGACDLKTTAIEHEALLLDELFRAMLEELMSGKLPATNLAES